MRCGNHDAANSRSHANGHHANGHQSLGSALTAERIVLWRLRGSLDELACAVRCTSYGYTLCLELAGEPILLELQANEEVLADKAARLETWLLTQGWERLPDEQVRPF